MTGKFNLQIIHYLPHTEVKWLIWKRNIKFPYLCGLVTFSDVPLSRILFETRNYRALRWIDVLSKDYNEHAKRGDEFPYRCLMRDDDVHRKPTIEEYFKMSQLFKKGGTIYNKKKDEFIRNIK